ncbi:hypothetical protein [Mucilaginibacter inviolabilis]|uniref:hypothetical protein n=1 Tax=Mucilaginibacter inviolabilis TaxID=2714892 RepID=UPI00140B53A1|nr:hypothetical protein [Mucilaginibacter inviolabilis]
MSNTCRLRLEWIPEAYKSEGRAIENNQVNKTAITSVLYKRLLKNHFQKTGGKQKIAR